MDAAGNSATDTSGNPVPVMEDYVQEIGNPFDIWHNLNKMEIFESCRICYQHAENVNHHNFAWSY